LLRIVQEWEKKFIWNDFDEGEEIRKTIRAVKSYLYHAEKRFSREEDFFHLRGQDNILRYRPIDKMVIRVHEKDRLFETLARIAAARIAGCETIVSLPPDLQNPVVRFLSSHEGEQLMEGVTTVTQEDKDLAEMIPQIGRIRYAASDRVEDKVIIASAKTGFYIARVPVMMEGKIELLQYYRQQSICNSYHRYGNLGERALLK
jgi:RHH-type proline utilization regulon transcriptional repressor/proline dehydrogenase/delta 1-pyrroline-5-carboxylate dehydrogenase